MMKRYLTVFLTLCLLLMTNVCFAKLFDAYKEYENSAFMVKNPGQYQDFGPRWIYAYTRYGAPLVGVYALTDNDYKQWTDWYVDAASVRYTTLKDRQVIEFTIYGHCGEDRSYDEQSEADLYLIDPETCVIYRGSQTSNILWPAAAPNETGFPPRNVYTSDSAALYGAYKYKYDNRSDRGYYDYTDFRIEKLYQGMNAEQMHYHKFSTDPTAFGVLQAKFGHRYDSSSYQAIDDVEVENPLQNGIETIESIDFISDIIEHVPHKVIPRLLSIAFQVANSRGQ